MVNAAPAGTKKVSLVCFVEVLLGVSDLGKRKVGEWRRGWSSWNSGVGVLVLEFSCLRIYVPSTLSYLKLS